MSRWWRSAAHRRLARLVLERIPENCNDETGVDVVFHFAGPLMVPEFQGLRTGRIAKKKSVIVVQVAVFAELHDESEDRVLDILARSLLDAVALARTTVSKRRDLFPVECALEIANSVIRSIE